MRLSPPLSPFFFALLAGPLTTQAAYAGPCDGASGTDRDTCIDDLLTLMGDRITALEAENDDLQSQLAEAVVKRDDIEADVLEVEYDVIVLETSGFLTSTDLAGYATESWVTSQGYLGSTDLTGYATESWVTSQGYLTSESDPGYAASAAAGIASSDVAAWNGATTYTDDLATYLTVDTDALVVDGANLYVRSGSGSTAGTVNGLGNLIVGYDEGSASKTGSHNVVVGAQHGYSSYGGLVAGYDNDITSTWATVTGGRGNTASGDRSTVLGGQNNTASGQYATVTGGFGNVSSGVWSVAVGGYDNEVAESDSVLVGGTYNTIVDGSSGYSNVLVGGFESTLDGGLFYSVLSYGSNETMTSNGHQY